MKYIPTLHKLSFWAFAALAVIILSCSSENAGPVSPFATSPDARASEDAKSGGVYKGVIAGSSGTFAVVLQNGIKRIRVVLDGETRDLETTSLDSWVSGQPLKNVLFQDGDWQATFSVGSAGNVPSISFSIPGHTDPKVAIFKEYSTAQVLTYEGTYTGTSSGTWNFIIQGSALTGISRSSDGGSSLTFYGLVNITDITLDVIEGGGKISGDNVSGTWSDTATGGSGTWTGKRTM